MTDDNWKIRILVLDRGFVDVCYCPEPDGHTFWLPTRNSRGIRVWGTLNRGLGALAKGPTEQTVLDEMVSHGSVPVRAIIKILEVEEGHTWESYLNQDNSASRPESPRRTNRRR